MDFESICFGLGLVVVWVAAGHSGRPHMRRSAAVLVFTWLAVIFVNEFTGARDPALAFLFIDSVAALVLLRPSAVRVQALIGLVFAFQIVAHFLRLVSVWDDVDTYLFTLAAGGWLQMIILIVGALHGRRRRLAAGGDRRGDIGAHLAPHHRSLGEGE